MISAIGLDSSYRFLGSSQTAHLIGRQPRYPLQAVRAVGFRSTTRRGAGSLRRPQSCSLRLPKKTTTSLFSVGKKHGQWAQKTTLIGIERTQGKMLRSAKALNKEQLGIQRNPLLAPQVPLVFFVLRFHRCVSSRRPKYGGRLWVKFRGADGKRTIRTNESPVNTKDQCISAFDTPR